MLATHLYSMVELSPDQLCHHIKTRCYAQADALMDSLDDHAKKLEEKEAKEDPAVNVVLMLYVRLADELRQVIRFDRQLIFPLVQQPETGRPLPATAIHKQHERLTKILEKLRHQANGYVAQSGWSVLFKMFCDDAYQLEQTIQQVIYLKENLLIPKSGAALAAVSES